MAGIPTFVILSFTFLALGGISLTSAQFGNVDMLKEPEENYYIVKKKSTVKIECQAQNVEDIVFTCAGDQVPDSSVEKDDSDRNDNIISAAVTITRNDLRHGRDKLQRNEKYWCECAGTDEFGNVLVRSRRGFISLGQMAKKFTKHPETLEVIEGETATFSCGPPKSNPEPQFLWRKNGRRLDVNRDRRMRITDSGSLEIQRVNSDDVGKYQCVVKNLVGRRESNEGELIISSVAPTTAAPKAKAMDDDMEFPDPIPNKPQFISDFEPMYKVPEGGSVTLSCSIVSVMRIIIMCDNVRLSNDAITIKEKTDRETATKLFKAEVELDAEKIVSDDYYCQCSGWHYSHSKKRWNRETGVRANFMIVDDVEEEPTMPPTTPETTTEQLYIGDFSEQPSDKTVTVGDTVTFSCEAPMGLPVPMVYWEKDGEKINIDEEEAYSIDEDDDLTIMDVLEEDEGLYRCVAQNSAGMKKSRQAQLTVEEDEDDDNCEELLQSCKQNDLCQNPQCLADVESQCQENYDILDDIAMEREDLRDRCFQTNDFDECPAIQECLDDFSDENNDDDDMDLSMEELCRGRSSELDTLLYSFVTCVNNKLQMCNVDINQSNDTAVTQLLAQMCDRFYDLDSCDAIDKCELDFDSDPMIEDNKDYWCKTFGNVVQCVFQESDYECSMKNNFNAIIMDLKDEMESVRCPMMSGPSGQPDMQGGDDSDMEKTTDDDVMNPTTMPKEVDEDDMMTDKMDGVNAQPTDDSMSESTDMDKKDMDTSTMEMSEGSKPDMDDTTMAQEESNTVPGQDNDEQDDDDDDDDEDDNEEEPKAGGSTDSASIPVTSIVLTTCLQLILATLLSWR